MGRELGTALHFQMSRVSGLKNSDLTQRKAVGRLRCLPLPPTCQGQLRPAELTQLKDTELPTLRATWLPGFYLATTYLNSMGLPLSSKLRH